MSKQKSANINAMLNTIIEHVVGVETENFYFRAALSYARAHPERYGEMVKQFEDCQKVVQTSLAEFDPETARAPFAELRELVRQLARPL